MKKGLNITLLLLLVSSAVFAQERTAFSKLKPRHEFSVSVGAFPVLYEINVFMKSDIDSRYDPLSNYNRLQYYLSDQYYYGAFTAAYSYRLFKWFDIGGSVMYAGQYQSAFDRITDEKIRSYNVENIAFMISTRLSWLNNDNVRLYSALSVGATAVREHDKGGVDEKHVTVTYMPGFQATLIGCSVGKKIFGFGELGAGNQGVIKLGIGYRF